MDLICPNTNRTLVKKINCTLWLYTQNSLDFFILDYDDDTTQKIEPYKNLVNFFGVPVPNILSNPKTDSNGNGKYLLLNSEFQNDTRLTGFQYYGVSAGVINLTVKITFILLFIYSWTTI